MPDYETGGAGRHTSRQPQYAPLQLVKARSFFARVKGLHAYQGLPLNTGLWIIPCRAIHTFWLAYPIDVVFLDRAYRTVKTLERMSPGRMAVCLTAYSVIELRAGYCEGNPAYRHAIARAVVQPV